MRAISTVLSHENSLSLTHTHSVVIRMKVWALRQRRVTFLFNIEIYLCSVLLSVDLTRIHNFHTWFIHWNLSHSILSLFLFVNWFRKLHRESQVIHKHTTTATVIDLQQPQHQFFFVWSGYIIYRDKISGIRRVFVCACVFTNWINRAHHIFYSRIVSVVVFKLRRFRKRNIWT